MAKKSQNMKIKGKSQAQLCIKIYLRSVLTQKVA